jgi:signal transduction histidine kinase
VRSVPFITRPAAAPWGTLLRIALTGALCALLVTAVGTAWRRATLGADLQQARARVEADVHAAFDTSTRGLRDLAGTLADPALVHAATAGGDPAASRRLFTLAADAVAGDRETDLAVTIHGIDGRPIAWAGRPFELPLERLQGPETWFLSPGATGLRLVYVTPVSREGVRVGAVAAERPLVSLRPGDAAPGAGLQGTAVYLFPTRLAPVSVELPFEGARTREDPNAVHVLAPSGERLLTALISPDDLAGTDARWRRATLSLSLIVIAVTVALLAGPLLDSQRRAHAPGGYLVPMLLAGGVVVIARLVLRAASPADWSEAEIFSGAVYASPLLPPLLASPFDLLVSALTAGALVALGLMAVDVWRVRARHRRCDVTGTRRVFAFALINLCAGIGVGVVLIGHEALLRDTIAHTTLDVLRLSLHQWQIGHLALQIGLIAAHAAALGMAVLILQVALLHWRIPRGDWRVRTLAVSCWVLPLALWKSTEGGGPASQWPILVALGAAAALAIVAARVKARYRHGSQAFRLTLLAVGLAAPAFAFYPSLFQLSRQAKLQLVETRYAPQALYQRQTLQAQLEESLGQIDRFPGLAELIAADVSPRGPEVLTDRAFQVWQTTALAAYPITSSVELYGPNGNLVGRFAFNLPEDLSATPTSEERTCEWDLYEEVAPFFAEERRILHAGRRICDPDRPDDVLGSIVVHAMPDYENLPFIASRSPYVELVRPADPLRGEGLTGRDVEYVHYGWSRTSLYWSGDTAWPIPDATFARVEESRAPLWAELRRDSTRYDVYLLNDRGGIYALGFPIASPIDHLVNLAELIVLAAGTFLLLLGGSVLFGWLSRRRRTAAALLREIRASFYRKLFLAFVAAVFLPVALLALFARTYVANEMRANVGQEALRTASVARRVVEDLVAPRAAQLAVGVDDNLMVWVSRLIGQDVNIFDGTRLVATSERNLFASGLLPTRTPADVYHALQLRNEATIVTRERLGQLEYLVAATPLTVRQLDATLTVPLTSRQREIDAQIDTLDRRVLLGALLFILAGAGLGYTMAERIADPVNRLTRATRRIARGELDVRVAATSSDELRRLVQDFNSMAAELQRQRLELERTHRLEAWAEMARQVAHEIKNPLTPIQLNAEHLRRVHADRGEPLGPVLQECVGTILTQVRLLRQIASEFSSFASSPTARRGAVDVADLVRETLDAYRTSLASRITFTVDIPPDLPPVYVDRTLVSRSLTNLVENALHAMPGQGTLAVAARRDGGAVRVAVSDTGVGMDADALARAFEPYFSTKATGTGLGLPIAKRNVELSGGTISVTSERDRGTTLEMVLPAAAETGEALQTATGVRTA